MVSVNREIPTANIVYRFGWAMSKRSPYFTAMAGAWYTFDTRSKVLLSDVVLAGEGTAVWY